MRLLHIWLGLFWCLSLSGQSFSTQVSSPIRFQEISLEEARRLASREDKLFLMYFSAAWCMPCRWMEENTFWDGKLVTFIGDHYIPVKVNVDQTDNRSLQEQFAVSKLPTILIFSAAGVLLDKVEAAVEAPRLLRLLKKHDRPANHRIADAQLPTAQAMESPKPRLGFSKPALIPDVPASATGEADSGYTIGSQPMHTSTTKPPLLIQHTETANAVPIRTQEMAPRQVARYGIQTTVTADYQLALQEVQRLESKFEQVVEAYPYEVAKETVYAVVVGSFTLKSEARKLLIYLNRNDITGQIINIAAE